MLTDPHAWVAFITLSALEIVLGIDNIIFISILVSRLPPARREAAATIGRRPTAAANRLATWIAPGRSPGFLARQRRHRSATSGGSPGSAGSGAGSAYKWARRASVVFPAGHGSRSVSDR